MKSKAGIQKKPASARQLFPDFFKPHQTAAQPRGKAADAPLLRGSFLIYLVHYEITNEHRFHNNLKSLFDSMYLIIHLIVLLISSSTELYP